jgi:hypothetical protein
MNQPLPVLGDLRLPEVPSHSGQPAKPIDALMAHLGDAGFCFMPGAELRAHLASQRADWDADWQRFAASWADLALDRYMADGGRYRRRRYATLSASPQGRILIEPHQPHYQSLDYNRLNGGVARYLEPILDGVIAGSTMKAVICLRGLPFTIASGVRAITTKRSARVPLVHQSFSPLITQEPSACFTASVTMLAGSEPAPGSVRANAESSPFAMRGSHFFFCVSVPKSFSGWGTPMDWCAESVAAVEPQYFATAPRIRT